jgi:hypothetical protein
VLNAIQRLPVSWPLLQGSSLLPTAARFAAARNERTAATAQQLLRHWGQRFDDLAMASVVQRAGAGKPTTFLQVVTFVCVSACVPACVPMCVRVCSCVCCMSVCVHGVHAQGLACY